MSISKRFRAGCLGLMVGTLGTPAIAQPPEATPLMQLAQVTEGEAAETPDASATPAAEPPAPSSVISVTTGDIVLLDAGQGEKSPLRLSPEVGNQMQLGADLTMTVSVEVDGQTLPNPGFPGINMVLGMEVVAVDEAGQITYHLTYDDISLDSDSTFPEAAREMMDGVLQDLKSLKLVLVGDDRGRVLSAKVEAPEGLNPSLTQMLDSLSQSMQQVSAPLPEEAIGIGARWSTTGGVMAGGLTLEQTLTYELVERVGDRFTVNIDVVQTAEAQSIGEASFGIQLTEYAATGNGNLVLDIGYPLPVSGLIDLVSITELENTQFNHAIVSRAEVRMELAPVEASGPE